MPTLINRKIAQDSAGDVAAGFDSNAGNTEIATITRLSGDSVVSVYSSTNGYLTKKGELAVGDLVVEVWYFNNIAGGIEQVEAQTTPGLRVLLDLTEWSGLTV